MEEASISAGPASALPEGIAAVVELDGVEVVVIKADGQFFALENECSHRGCMLSDGEVEGGEIACPCHGAVFDLRSGVVLAGPAPHSQQTYTVRLVDGEVEVCKP